MMRRWTDRFSVTAALAIGASALWQPVFAAGNVDSSSMEDAKAFLRQYAIYSAVPNGELLGLYSDRAVVRARAADQPTDNVFQGSAYKQWVRALVLSRKSVLDASVFKDATVERRAGRLVIRAKRYAMNRCYWDGNYLLGIEREAGQWRIVEERMTTQPQASCSAAQAQANQTLQYNSALNVAVGSPGVSGEGPMATAALGAPGVNVGAVTSLQVPMAAPHAQFAQPMPAPPTFYSVPVQPSLPQVRLRPPAPVQTLSPEQQADLAMRMALQIAGRPQAAAATPNTGVGTTPAVANVQGATPAVANTLLVTPPQ